MTTALDLINLALRRVGALGVGQTAEPEHALDCLKLFNMMLAQWQRKRWMVWHLVDVSCISTGAPSYTVAPSGDFAVARIDHIAGAFGRQTIPMQVDYPLDVIASREDYSNITLKTFSAFPRFVYYDAVYPIGKVYVWPVPPANSVELHLLVKEQLGSLPELSSPVLMPAEYQEAIVLNLCLRLYPYFQLSADKAREVAKEAKAAMEVVKNANAMLAKVKLDPDLLGKVARRPGGGFLGGGIKPPTPPTPPSGVAPAVTALPTLAGSLVVGSTLAVTP